MIEFNIDWILVLQFVIATLLPLLVGIVTTRVTSPAAKAVLLAVLSFIAGILTEITQALVNGEVYDVGAGLLRFLSIFVVSVATYFGLWSRPTATGPSITAKLTDDVGRTAGAPADPH